MAVIERRLEELGITLGEVLPPKFSYVPCSVTGNLLYTSGFDCRIGGVLMYEGKLGSDLTIEQGREAARQTAINLIGAMKAHLGDLDRIVKIVKILGFVSSAPGFADQPLVMNGASDLLIDVFGDKGRHARSAIGTSELPFNTPVEIELIAEIRD